MDYESLKKILNENKLNAIESAIKNKKSASEIYETEKLLAYNLEIRKLQLNDSGWYECQLNTKPTVKNYIYLKVLSLYTFLIMTF